MLYGVCNSPGVVRRACCDSPGVVRRACCDVWSWVACVIVQVLCAERVVISGVEGGRVLRRALDFAVEDQGGKGRLKRTWKTSGWGRRCEGWTKKGRCTLPFQVECWC